MKKILICCLLLCTPLLAADFATRGELQTELYNRLETNSDDNFWDTTLVNRILDKAVTEVQLFLQCYRGEDTIGLSAQTYRYGAPSDMAEDGVLFAFFQSGGSNSPRHVRPVSYVLPDDFGKVIYPRVEEFTVINNLLLLNATPDGSDSLYLWYYKITSHAYADTCTISIPQQHRGFVLDLAFADCKRIRGFLQFYQAETQRIYGQMREIRERFPKAEPQAGLP